MALKELGYRVLHSEGKDLKEQGVYVGSFDLWSKIVGASRQIFKGEADFGVFDPILAHVAELGVNATTDVPWSVFVDDLLKRYPKAKVILTVRDPEKWYDSYYRAHRLLSVYPEKIHLGITYKKRTNRMLLQGGCDHAEAFPPWPPAPAEKQSCIEGFRRHNDKVRALVPEGQLLVYSMGEGWGPLCEFLGREVPAVPFPRRDDVDAAIQFPAVCSHPTVAATVAIYLVHFFPSLCCCICCCLGCFRWRRRRGELREGGPGSAGSVGAGTREKKAL